MPVQPLLAKATSPRLLHVWFEKTVSRFPNRVAVTCAGESWSYAELNQQADELARLLVAHGAGPELPVAICVERSLELVAGLIAILKAGSPYVPIDLSYPPERLAFMLEDSKAPLLLTQRHLAAKLPPHRAQVICLDDVPLQSGTPPASRMSAALTAASTAYILYTSGSTGRPKGCCVTHRNVDRLFTATEPWFHFNEEDVWTLFHSTAFDFSVWEMWGALLYGGRLVVVPHAVSRVPEEFLSLLIRERVTVLNQTPGAFRQLMAAEQAGQEPADLALRYVIFGGEALAMGGLQPWFARHGDQHPQLVNMYGITETTVHVTYRPLKAADVATGSVIGVPIPDLQVHVLDPQMQPCPAGVAGEMFIGGAGVARGYLNRPELTAERFIPSPFDPGAILYRSGDLARRLPDGDLEYLGRLDQQVKIRGFRVELGEIESALLTHPAVREAVVLAQEGGHDETLTAHLVLRGERPTVPELRTLLGRTLPDYMIPAAFLSVEKIPLTPNGKTDRAALARDVGQPLDAGRGYVAPRNPLEADLAEMWRTVLGWERVGIHDNFFEIGGHSLLAMRVSAGATRLLNTPVPVGLLFQQPILADYAAALQQAGLTPAAAPPETSLPGESFPLSPMQQGMLVSSLAAPGSGVDFEQIVWRVEGDVDAGRLAAAWQRLAAQHDILRTAFRWEGREEPCQVFYPEIQVGLTELDWRGLPAAQRGERFREFLAADRARGVDLSRPPLWRVTLLRETEADARLVWSMHHALMDGRSLVIMLRDLQARFTALQHETQTEPAAGPPFQEYLAWLGRQDWHYAGRFWREQLADAPILPLPNLGPRPSTTQPARGFRESVELRLSGALTVGMHGLAQRLEVTTNTLVQAAWAVFLSRATGQSDVVFGATRACRHSALQDGPQRVGIFINTLPLRVRMPPEAALGDCLLALRQQQLDLRDYEHTPLARIQEWCAHGRPLFDTLVMFERSEWATELRRQGAGWAARDFELHEAPGFPLSLLAYDGEALLFRCHYDPIRFTRETALGILEYLQTLLACMVNEPATSLSRLPQLELETRPADAEKPIPRRTVRTHSAPPTIRRLPRGAPLPLSAEQRRLWLVHQTVAMPAAYNVPLALRLTGFLDLTLLEASLHGVVARHEILRTRFVEIEGEPRQEVVELQFTGPGSENSLLDVTDLTGLPEAEREGAASRLFAVLAATPFDLAVAPLWRLSVLKLSEEAHLLLLNVQHLICDEWSLRLLLAELEAIYRAGGDPRAAALPELPVQYADYAAWQLEQAQDPHLAADRTYWRDCLQGIPAEIELPFDHPRPKQSTMRGGRITVTLPAVLMQQLERLGNEAGATWFMLLLTAWQALLGRLTGQNDLVVATPLALREQSGVQALIGFFLNTVPVRTCLDPELSFRRALLEIRESVLKSLEHGRLPFDEIVRLSSAPRHLGATPLSQVMLVVTNEMPLEISLPGVRCEGLEPLCPGEKFDLTLFCSPLPGGDWQAALHYSEDIFEPATSRRMAEQLVHLLESLAAAPDAPLETLDLLPAAQRRQLVEEFNRTEPVSAAPDGLHELLHEQVRQTPGAMAVVDESGSLTYQQLDAQSNRLARYLQELGVGPGALVGIGLERSLEMVVAMVATLKAGGAYVPLDPGYPRERLEFMIEDSGLKVLLTNERVSGRWPDTRVPQVPVDAAWAKISRQSPAPLPVVVSPEDAAYVIYTSGSTGRPKGVVVPHRAVAGHILAASRAYGITRADRVLGFASPSFDAAVEQMWTALSTGAVFVLRGNDWVTARELTRLISQQELTVINVPPAMWMALAEEWLQPDAAALVSRLRLVIVGGDVMLASGLALWRRTSLSRVRLLNAYGPTETTITALLYEASTPAARARIPIGRPLGNRRCYILNEARQLAPVAVAGELFIGGGYLARGYLNRPELTAEKFIPDPFSDDPQARLYRTGDRCRWLPEGNIEFLGRLDDQVKIRGFRIELGEIEAMLARHPGVTQVAVLARELADGARELVAYLTPVAGQSLAEDPREFLRRRLPGHMVPADFVLVAQMPLTPNGKIDRRALTTVVGQVLVTETTPEAPRDATEGAIAGIWQDLLGRTPIGIHDDFFSLGGHSLLAMRVAARLTRSLGLEVPVRLIFHHPTIAGLAAALAGAGPAQMQGLIPAVPRGGSLPVSPEQEGLWFLHQVLADPAAYNVTFAVRLRGELDLPRLERAWQRLSQRHEILRMKFIAEEGVVRQIPVATLGPIVALEDLGKEPAAGREQALQRALVREAARPFDLAAAPLFRVTCLRLDPAEQVLVLTLHHIICDEWSTRLLWAELEQFHASDSDLAGLLPLAIQYADYAAWQRAQAGSPALAAQRDFWRAQMAGAPAAIDLPADRMRLGRASCRGGQVNFMVEPTVAEALHRLGREEAATPFMVWLALFAALLHRLSGQDDLLIGTPMAQRRRPEVQPLAGFFLNTVPLRSREQVGDTFRELLQRARAVVLGAFENSELPLDEIIKLHPAARAAQAPSLLQVLFVMLNEPPALFKLAGVEAEPVPVDPGTSKFDLTLFLTETGTGGLEGILEFSADLFERVTVERMAGQLQQLARSVSTNPSRPLRELELLPAEQRRQVIEDFNRTKVDFDLPDGVQELFEAQARRTPEAPAVMLGDERMTYAELNQRANAIANELRRLGVGPDVLVGICLERSPDMVAAVLGTMKAGGACLPLDPGYPAERLQFMLEDVQPAVVLTQSSLAACLPAHDAPRLLLDTWQPSVAPSPDAPPPRDRERLAYVLFTSGSTGRPKGVGMPQRALLNLIAWQNPRSGCGPGDRTLQFASLNFDVSFQELFATLASGGTLVLVPETTRRDLSALALAIREQRVARLFVPFVVLDNLAALLGEVSHKPPGGAGVSPALSQRDAGSTPAQVHGTGDGTSLALKEIITAGEQLRITPALVKLFECLPEAVLVNQYGPTETHVVSAFTLTGEPAKWPALPPIGGPIANTRIYLLDEQGQAVPIGVPGELCVGGVQVARGYLNRPELTAERFVRNPFSADPNGRLYRTGDRCRWLPDGTVEYLGRRDEQVKVRGFRIELGEIEAALNRHPGVRQAAVIARDDDRELVAFVARHDPAAVGVESLRAQLRVTLPEYMVPARFVMLDALLFSPNGKVDRRALAARAGEGMSTTTAAVVPSTAAESGLVEVWSRVLGNQFIGVEDDFFALGGHSLLALRLMREVENRFGHSLPLASLFAAPTIRQFARLLEDHLAATATAPAGRLRGHGEGVPLFYVPGIGGYEFLPEAVARRVGGLRPFYDGLQYPGLDGRQTPLNCVELIATHLITQIEQVSPTGTLCLGGYSFGGVVAYEVARQLQARGRRVEVVLLFDSFAPAAFRKRSSVETVAALRRHLTKLGRREQLNFLVRLVGRKLGWLGRGLTKRFAALGNCPASTAPADMLTEGDSHKLHVLQAALLAYEHYRPAPYEGRVVVFQVEERDFGAGVRYAPDPLNGWQGLIRGGLEVVSIPGDHTTMLQEPAVNGLAGKVAECLKGADSASHGKA